MQLVHFILAGNQIEVNNKRWAKGVNISGNVDSDYSFYIDITYTDNSRLYGQVIQVPFRSHLCNE